MTKKPKLSTLKKKLDKIFSEFIRLRDSDERGMCKCVTCPTVLPWKQIHNGHWISRARLSVRFDERNCHAQCCGCNTFKNGEPQKYFVWMENEYGREVVGEMMALSNKTVKLTPAWYEEKILFYKEKVNQLKNSID